MYFRTAGLKKKIGATTGNNCYIRFLSIASWIQEELSLANIKNHLSLFLMRKKTGSHALTAL
jgi:hypothetical protein